MPRAKGKDDHKNLLSTWHQTMQRCSLLPDVMLPSFLCLRRASVTRRVKVCGIASPTEKQNEAGADAGRQPPSQAVKKKSTVSKITT